MKTIDSKVILSDGKVIKCKYYEIENICKKLIDEYCSMSDENNKIFNDYAKNYKTFKPYFDFAMTELGIRIENAFMEEGSTCFAEDKTNILKTDKEGKEYYAFSVSDDITLDIHPMGYDPSLYNDCIIDSNANHIMREHPKDHVYLISQILNLLLISNENVANDYLNDEYIEDGIFLSRYYPFLRFQADKEGFMFITKSIYRESNKTKKMGDFIEFLLDNRYTYSSYLRDVGRIDDFANPCDLSSDLKYNNGIIKKQ